MALAINHNLMAANTARNLNTHYGNLATSTHRLSSGLRINGASDDAAGLAIRELMRADVAALHQGARNANDAISLIQTADGALGIIDEKLIRMKELAEQAATGTYDSTQRLMIESEYQAMASEITRIANATDFNGIKLLNGSLSGTHDGSKLNSSGKLKIHFGNANDSAEDYYYIDIGNCTAAALGLGNTALVSREGKETKYYIEYKDFNNGVKTELKRQPGYGHFATMEVVSPPPDPDNVYELYDPPPGYFNKDGDYIELYNGTIVPGDSSHRIPWGRSFGDDIHAYTESWETPNRREFFGCEYLVDTDHYLSPVLNEFVKSETVATPTDELPDGFTISTQEAAQRALVAIDKAIVSKDKIRAHLGALQNRLENTVSNLTFQAENLQASESRISDVDVATEMTNFIRHQVLTQSAVAMLSQANSMPQMAMRLIGG